MGLAFADPPPTLSAFVPIHRPDLLARPVDCDQTRDIRHAGLRTLPRPLAGAEEEVVLAVIPSAESQKNLKLLT